MIPKHCEFTLRSDKHFVVSSYQTLILQCRFSHILVTDVDFDRVCRNQLSNLASLCVQLRIALDNSVEQIISFMKRLLHVITRFIENLDNTIVILLSFYYGSVPSSRKFLIEIFFLFGQIYTSIWSHILLVLSN